MIQFCNYFIGYCHSVNSRHDERKISLSPSSDSFVDYHRFPGN